MEPGPVIESRGKGHDPIIREPTDAERRLFAEDAAREAELLAADESEREAARRELIDRFGDGPLARRLARAAGIGDLGI